MHLGLSEIIVVVLVLIILIKPDKVSEYAATFGKTVKEFNEAKNTVKEGVGDIEANLTEATDIIKGKEEKQ